jgi:hypothetical protein
MEKQAAFTTDSPAILWLSERKITKWKLHTKPQVFQVFFLFWLLL